MPGNSLIYYPKLKALNHHYLDSPIYPRCRKEEEIWDKFGKQIHHRRVIKDIIVNTMIEIEASLEKKRERLMNVQFAQMLKRSVKK
ncbi:unnamed protein product [Rhizophagus irregularis]|nr:unnamed protein product [Rhizophagus irregularis]